jgi:magnesium chelatase family protein
MIPQPALCRNSSRVLAARERQHVRFAVPLNGQPERGKASAKSAAKPIFCNSQMNTQQIRTFCDLSADAERLLERAMQQQGLTARTLDRSYWA